MSIVSAHDLIKRYGRKTVVDEVSFHVDPGEIVGLLGPNGAGKTTCFNMVCGLIDPTGGKVILNDVDVTRWSMTRRARDGRMGYLAQDSSVFRKLSVENNLLGMMEMIGISRAARKKRCDELLERFNVAHLRKRQAARLSGGERRRVEIARSLVSDPNIILLDEPFNAIDPVTVDDLRSLIGELSGQGIAILITDHKAEAILKISNRVYVLDEGRLLTDGPPAEVAAHPEVKRKYLGDTAIDLVGLLGAAAATRAAEDDASTSSDPRRKTQRPRRSVEVG